jgi:hypothetical protein
MYGEARMASRFGLAAECGFAKKWAIQSGVTYSAENYQAYFNGLIFGNQIDPRGTAYYPNGSAEFKFRGMEVPVLLSFQTGGKVKFVANIGMVGNYLLQRSVQWKNVVPKGTLTDDLSYFKGVPRLNLSLLGGVGARFELSEKVALQVLPYYQRWLLPVRHEQFSMDTKLAKAGMDMQVLYRLH